MLPGIRIATDPDRAFNLFNVQAIKTRTNPQVGTNPQVDIMRHVFDAMRIRVKQAC